MIERDQHVRELLDVVGAGDSTAVLVTGEAGIGKTSLIREVVARVGPEYRVLVGSCDDFLAPPLLQPIRDAFRVAGGPMATATEPEAVFDAFLNEFRRPTVLVIEDVHWADDATLDVLRYLVHRLEQLPGAIVILTYREDAIDGRHPLRGWLGALADVPIRRINLQPLSLDAVRSIAAGSGRDATELFELTGGNPFYLTEVLAGPGDTIPATVVDAVLARFGRLDADSLAVVEQLSVIPTTIELQHITKVVGGKLDGLSQAEQAGVLETHGNNIGFRHELARRAIEQALPPMRRRLLNAHILELMIHCGDVHQARVVHHAVEAGDIAVLLEHGPRAAREASLAGSHRQALAHLEAVLPYADRLTVAERAALLDGYAWELHIAHRFADAVNAGQQAVELLGQLGESVALVETLMRQSRFLYMAGDTAASVARSDKAIAIASRVGAVAVRASAAAGRGMLLALTGDAVEAISELERAHELACEAGRTDIDALCHNYLGLAWCDLGSPTGLKHLRTSIELAESTGDYEAVARGYTNLAEMLYRELHWGELADCLRAGLEFVRERGFGSHAYNLEVHQALLDLRQGEWAAAEERLRRLIDSVDDQGMLSVLSLSSLGRVLARRGAPEAEGLLADVWKRARRQRSLTGFAYAATAYAEWAWLNDRPDLLISIKDEVSHLTEIQAFRRLPGSHGWTNVDDPYEQALELAESGDSDEALQALQVLDRLGAAPAAAMVRRRLKELGVARIPRGAQTRTRQNPCGLTERQLEVLVLLADGLTNPQIAGELVLSVRTVDRHVSAILGRLDARTRQEAAAAARSLGLAGERSA
ncbi:LuxR family transcriptional regulator [Streptomyces sp. SID13031]|uniref:ATP-binding protein n=1 Tax=Streptomyces sp. SID13031 TaxID=2706046 RepID=UPI0013C5FBCF|nr:LuxR family transcriptional regulator [Streptomyces sp. SID13031]NEA34261.1 AAA family ATPase [Streptomyces sp. SID13031]